MGSAKCRKKSAKFRARSTDLATIGPESAKRGPKSANLGPPGARKTSERSLSNAVGRLAVAGSWRSVDARRRLVPRSPPAVLQDLGQQDEAEGLYRQALETAETNFGPIHETTMQVGPPPPAPALGASAALDWALPVGPLSARDGGPHPYTARQALAKEAGLPTLGNLLGEVRRSPVRDKAIWAAVDRSLERLGGLRWVASKTRVSEGAVNSGAPLGAGGGGNSKESRGGQLGGGQLSTRGGGGGQLEGVLSGGGGGVNSGGVNSGGKHTLAARFDPPSSTRVDPLRVDPPSCPPTVTVVWPPH